jgi:hypothetical protein
MADPNLPTTLITCIFCSATNAVKSVFCMGCGRKLCLECGATLNPKAKFCSSCGATSDAQPSSSNVPEANATWDPFEPGAVQTQPSPASYPPNNGNQSRNQGAFVAPPQEYPESNAGSWAEPVDQKSPVQVKGSPKRENDDGTRKKHSGLLLLRWIVSPLAAVLGVYLIVMSQPRTISVPASEYAPPTSYGPAGQHAPTTGHPPAVQHKPTIVRTPLNSGLAAGGVLLIVGSLILFGLGRSGSNKTSKTSARGIVHNFQTRSEGGGTRTLDKVQRTPFTVWTWTLARTDPDGNSLPEIAVEMKAKKFTGFLSNGHDVETFDTKMIDGLLVPSRVFNHSTRSWINVR